MTTSVSPFSSYCHGIGMVDGKLEALAMIYRLGSRPGCQKLVVTGI